MATGLTPVTRRELYLSAAAGETETSALPTPVTREEIYLNEIAQGGGGGGFTPTEGQLTAMNSGIDSTKVAQIETNKTNILSIENQLYPVTIVHDFLSSSTYALNNDYLWIDTVNIIPKSTIPDIKVVASKSGVLDIVFLRKSSTTYTVISTVSINCSVGENQITIPNAATIADNSDVYIGFHSTAETIKYKSSGVTNDVTRIEYNQAVGTFTPSGTFKLDFNYKLVCTAKISTIDQIANEVETITNKFVVVSPTNGDYSDIYDAITSEPENTTIIVKPGVYNCDMTSCLKKRIILIGVDRNQCIIRDSDGRYGHHPLYVSCGYFENLTIIAPYVSGESQEIGVSDLGAYAVHIDTDDDYAVGKQIEFHHCTIQSDFFPAIGAGLRKDMTIIIDDCDILNNQVANRGDYSDEGTLGALYVHNTNGQKGNQYLKVKDSVLRSNLGNSLCLYQTSSATTDDNVYCDFTNNVLYDSINGYTNNIWFRGDPFNVSTGRFKISIGYGNSNSDINSVTE